jgi:transposase
VDTGYLDGELLIGSRDQFQVDLVGPTRKDYRWQAQAKRGFEAACFAIDWERQTALCPEGKTSLSWTPAVDQGQNDVIKIKFSARDCAACPSRPLCTTSTRHHRRTLTIRPHGQYLALRTARDREQTEEFKQLYAQRAGIEGTHSQAVRRMHLRRSRYLGQQKTLLQHVLTATAINLVRLVRWQAGIPIAATRQSPFIVLMTSAA